MSEGRKDRIRRILIAIDASPQSMAALEAAAELAAKMDAELQALFVEDVNLLRLAELPIAREVGLQSLTIRRIDPERMRRQIRARRDLARQAVEMMAEQADLHWSFQVSQGSVTMELLRATQEVDLVILGRIGWSGKRTLGSTAREMARRAPRRALIHALQGGLRPSVLLIFDGTEESLQALSTACQMVRSTDSFLTVGVLAEDDRQARQRQKQAAEMVRDYRVEYRVRWLIEPDLDQLIEILEGEGDCVLVMSRGMSLGEEGDVEDLMQTVECPVLLV